MGGQRRLMAARPPARSKRPAGPPRLLYARGSGRHYNAAEGWAYRRKYTVLEEELGPFTALQRDEAGRVAAAWVHLMAATAALSTARHVRAKGRGRRPSVQAIARLAKRQGLADASYSQALDKLRELVQANGRPRPLAELLPRESAP
jgi:hypothetical protein